MEKKLGIVVLVVIIIGIIGGASVLYNYLSKQVETDRIFPSVNTEEGENPDNKDMTEDNDDEEYQKAPDFTVYDGEQNSYKLSDFEGKPVILNFWASWCAPCKSEMPDFEEAYKQYGEDISFLMVNMTDGYQETVDSAKQFIEDSGYTFPVYYDTKQEAMKAFNVYMIPTTYFLDENGNLIVWGQGAMDAKTLQTGIDYIYN